VSRRRTTPLALLAALLLASGCGLLPTSGPVHEQAASPGISGDDQTYFYPPGPAKGADRVDIVKGFLVAMQANPINTGAARGFLSEHARTSWAPDGGTIVYDSSTVEQHGRAVVVRLTGTHRIDASGVWEGGPARRLTLHFAMTRDQKQWRIDDPVSALMVRSSYFQSRFGAYDLYFFDQGNRVLVPQTVYVPDGELAASTLVRGLLNGPDARLSGVAHSSFPVGATLDPSVVVSDRGVAEVPLSEDVLKLSPGERNQALVQLAWTLSQVSGIDKVRITVNGTPLAVPDGRTDFGVDDGTEFAPTGLGATRELVAIHDNRIVTISGHSVSPVAGAFGKRGLLLRSVALDRSGSRLVAVTQSGSIAFVGSTTATGHVTRIYSGATDLLRPRIDLFGTIWLLDRTAHGAVVHAIDHGHDRVVHLPGISGKQVSSFSLSPDGTRIAAGITQGVRPQVTVDVVQRNDGGVPTTGTGSIPLRVASYDPSHELGPVVDLGWRSPTTLAVLTRPKAGTNRVVYVTADGSPGSSTIVAPDAFQGDATGLVVNADSGVSLMLVDSHGHLDRLDAAGKWEPVGLAGIAAATYAD
jgi:hypothetical protein